jgi:hypothetical protein
VDDRADNDDEGGGGEMIEDRLADWLSSDFRFFDLGDINDFKSIDVSAFSSSLL